MKRVLTLLIAVVLSTGSVGCDTELQSAFSFGNTDLLQAAKSLSDDSLQPDQACACEQTRDCLRAHEGIQDSPGMPGAVGDRLRDRDRDRDRARDGSCGR